MTRILYARSSALAVLALSALCVLPAFGSATEDLAAIAQRRTKAFSEGNADAIVADFAEDAVYTSPRASFRVEGKAAIRAYYADVFQQFPQRKVTARQVTTRFYAGETMAVVNAYAEVALIDKNGVPHVFPTRASSAYAKVDGRWLLVEYHQSVIPGPHSP